VEISTSVRVKRVPRDFNVGKGAWLKAILYIMALNIRDTIDAIETILL
jgi:hypothetical protein